MAPQDQEKSFKVILPRRGKIFLDLGVTSPPYNKGENKKGWLVENVKYSGVVDKLPEDVYQKEQMLVLDEIFRVTKQGGVQNYKNEIRYVEEEMAHHVVIKTFKERKEKGEFTGRYGKKNSSAHREKEVLELFKL